MQRHVQPPRRGLAQLRVVAGDGDPDHLAHQRPAPLGRGQQVRLFPEDPLGDGDRLGSKTGRSAKSSRAGQVAEQVVGVVLAVGPQPVDRAARHPGPLDDLLEPQVLDGERRAGLKGQLPPGVEHPLPDLFRRYPLRPGRHGLAHPRRIFETALNLKVPCKSTVHETLDSVSQLVGGRGTQAALEGEGRDRPGAPRAPGRPQGNGPVQHRQAASLPRSGPAPGPRPRAAGTPALPYLCAARTRRVRRLDPATAPPAPCAPMSPAAPASPVTARAHDHRGGLVIACIIK